MKMSLLPFIALVAALSISGCASVTRGTKDTLVVESDPAGAEVRLSTGGAGKTPTSFKLPRKKELEVFIEKEGFEPLTVHVSSQVSGTGAVGMAGNVLVGGLIGVGIDSYTGASKDLRPNPIKVTLVAKKTPTPGLPGDAQPTDGKAQVAAAAAPADAQTASTPTDIAPVFKPTGIQVGMLPVKGGVTPSKVQDLIAVVLTGREWDVKEKGNGHVVGHIKHRSNEAVLTLVYDADYIKMYCEGWKIDKKTGSHLKPQLPENWIQNIRDDLSKRLAEA